ncbi:EAL and HDOD domain-containing protein [Idiomarina xiamenensis]|uniref:EAL domain-containing protein n=1 Tax=Idiomarina xiamenensis 10-D-4 TaxID=740709 RepID=K2KDI4_9GAMM|nr:HDOD domain-containing protein [Idiomarina xiamenensis]EKE84777.1 EAL domain-containing protein [Idiomarina xiamenensis 10-D-4]
MFFYLARQPIFNRQQQLFAYELLFRDGPNNAFPDISPEEATARLVETSEFNGGIESLTDGHPAFINFTESALLNQLPLVLPNQHLVVEILETVKPSNEIIEAVKRLRKKGYRLALDDFEYNDSWNALLPYIDLVKIDFRALPIAKIQQHLKQMSAFSLKFLAEKIETQAEFKQAYELGFSYFQGYFFARPELMQKRQLSASQMALLDLLKAINDDNFSIDEVSNIVQHDAALTYKLLRFVNSAVFKRNTSIDSIRKAVVFLGQQELQKFVAIVATAQINDDKPSALMHSAIVRARFCEILAQTLNQQQAATQQRAATIDAASAFLCGLFSLLDAMMDDSLENLLTRIAVNADVYRALVNQQGELANLLTLVQAYEQADWSAIHQQAAAWQLDEAELSALYHRALHWSAQLKSVD